MAGLQKHIESALAASYEFVRGRCRARADAGSPAIDQDGFLLGTAMPFSGSNLAEGQPVWLSERLMGRHIAMYGGSGAGKSTVIRRLLRHWYGRVALLNLDFSGDLVDGEMPALAAMEDPPDLALVDLGRAESFVPPFNLLGGPGTPHARAAGFLRGLESETGAPLGVRVFHNAHAAAVALAELGLCATEFRALFAAEPGFRRHVIASVCDDEARDALRELDRQEATVLATLWAEISNKVSRVLASPDARLMTSLPGFLDLSAALDDPCRATHVALRSATQPAAGLFAKKLLGAVEGHAMARASLPEHRRPPARIVVDEASRVAGFGLERLLYEGRRMNVTLVLVLQQTTQVEPELRDAIRANASVSLLFSAGGAEASALAGEIACDLPREEVRRTLVGLPVGTAFLLRRGEPPALVRLPDSPVPSARPEAVEALRLAALARANVMAEDARRSLNEKRAWTASFDSGPQVEHVTRPSKGGRRDG